MNEAQKVICTLLKEVDLLFKNAGIAYCVADKIAWDCWKSGHFSSGYYQACLLVPASTLTVIENLEVLENRVFVAYEMPQNSRPMLRYVAEDTTLLAVDSYAQDTPGICIELYPVQKADEHYEITTCRTSTLRVQKDPFASSKRVPFEGLSLPIPNGIEEYLKTLLGAKWEKEYLLPVETRRYGVVIDPHTPYRDYVKEVVDAGIYDPSIVNRVREYERWKAKELAASASALSKQTEEFRLIMARYKMCEKYLPHKQSLLEAWQEGRTQEVAFAMADYTKRLKHFYMHGMSLFFDKEIFDLAIDVLLMEEWPSALKLRDMIDDNQVANQLSKKMAPYVL